MIGTQSHVVGNTAYAPVLAFLGLSELPCRLAGHTDAQVAAMCAEDGGTEKVALLLQAQCSACGT